MGEVFAAFDETLRRDVAVKLLAMRLCDDATMRERFLREATLAAALGSHPHVVTVHDAGLWNRRPYFVMELAAGSVADRLRAGTPDRRWALVWLAQAADALDAAHARGIVHRDVKPANLLVDEYGAVRVSDFGIARDEDTTLTGTGEVLGTAGYLAPEQARGERCTAASDHYSLAVVARELLTGTREGSVPAAAEAVFERALADDPAQRYPEASSFVDDLERSLVQSPTTKHTALLPARPPSRQPARRSALRPKLNRIGIALGAAVLAVVSALATYVLAVAPENEAVARAALRPMTCTASPVEHDANIVVRGIRAGTTATTSCRRSLRRASSGRTVRVAGCSRPTTARPRCRSSASSETTAYASTCTTAEVRASAGTSAAAGSAAWPERRGRKTRRARAVVTRRPAARRGRAAGSRR